jgi:hypothetical protein
MAAAVGLVACSSSSAEAVTLEPAATTGADPFTASVAIGPAVSISGNTQAVTTAARKSLPVDKKTHTLVASGTAPGLYGGTGDTHVCDPEQLVTFLSQHPGKAAAWASVLGINPANIKTYVTSLTPVILTSDTVVTNHGYRNGKATTLQSVLQAGTAVMVDSTGTPRVKCNCGNPLTPPQPINVASAHVKGPRWNGYASNAVTTVQPGSASKQLTLINITTGDTYSQPIGSGSAVWVAADAMPYGNTSTILTSADGTTWSAVGTVPGVAVTAIAYGDGKWIATADSNQNFQQGGQILESSDLKNWTKVADNLFHIGGVAYGNGRWVAVGAGIAGVAVGGLNHASRVEYSSTDGTHWSEVDISNLSTNDANMQQLESIAYGDGKWITVGIDERDDPSGQRDSVVTLKTFTSNDGSHWTAGKQWANVRPTQSGGGNAAVVHGDGQWVVGASVNGGVALHTSTDGSTWRDVAGPQFSGQALAGMAFGGGTYLAAALADSANGGGATNSSSFYTSTDAQSWKSVSTRASSIAAVAYGTMPTGAPNSAPSTLPASTPTCKSEYMWTAIKKAIGANEIPDIPSIKAQCSGAWGYVTFGMMTGGGARSLVVHWDDATRAWEPANDACAQGSVPADFASTACHGPGPGAGSTTTTPSTTAAPSGSSAAAHCNKAGLQGKFSPGAVVSSVYCYGDWAIATGQTPDAEGTDAFRWNGTSWDSVAQFVCDIPVPGLPQPLYNQVCHRG